MFKMTALLLIFLLSTVKCSDIDKIKKDENIEERIIVGGGNFGRFIGLTTYGAGPFLVKGKYDDDKDRKGKEKMGTASKNGYIPEVVGNVGYEDVEKNQVLNNRRYKYDEKEENEHIEYLGYNNARGYCIGEYRDRHNRGDYGQNRNTNTTNEFDREINDRCDKLFGFNGPTANDEPENLIRPCALDDWQCIRQYFAANSNCEPTFGPIPDPLYLDVSTDFYPVANVTLTMTNFIIRGLSSVGIAEFFANRISGNLVLALNVTNLNQTIPRAYVRYRRTAKESIVLADYATSNYPLVIMTAVIPKLPHLRLDLADIHADVPALPQYFLGPGAYNSTDPDVVSAFADLNANLPTSIRENILFKVQLLTSIYIQRNICDFGLEIISV